MFDKDNKRILVDIPLATHTGKVRIKSRSVFHEYGQHHSTRSVPFVLNNYVEWQIGYDLEDKRKNESSLPHKSFIAYNGKR